MGSGWWWVEGGGGWVVQQLEGEVTTADLQEAPAAAAPALEPSFDFLQDSQIDLESPHMDPAVVMVHPPKRPPLQVHVAIWPYGTMALWHIGLMPYGLMLMVHRPMCQVLVHPAAPPQGSGGPPGIPSQTFSNPVFQARQRAVQGWPLVQGVAIQSPLVQGVCRGGHTITFCTEGIVCNAPKYLGGQLAETPVGNLPVCPGPDGGP